MLSQVPQDDWACFIPPLRSGGGRVLVTLDQGEGHNPKILMNRLTQTQSDLVHSRAARGLPCGIHTFMFVCLGGFGRTRDSSALWFLNK